MQTAKPIILITTACALFAASAAAAPLPAGKTAVSTVNGKKITAEEVSRKLWGRYASATIAEMENDLLLSQEAERLGVKADDKEISEEQNKLAASYGGAEALAKTVEERGMTPAEFRADIKLRIAIRKLAVLDGKLSVSEEETRKLFDANKAGLSTPPSIRLRQIYTKTRQEAQDMLLALNSGADFKTLARQKAIDEQTAQKDGDVGEVYKGQLPKEIEDSLFALKKGQVSGIFDMASGGFAIFRVEDMKSGEEASFEKVRESLSANILQEKINSQIQQLIPRLRKEASIKENWRK